MGTVPQKIKIKDIAEKAGVSAGTVDRVLHNRGNVSEETKKKIKDILGQINYTPNLYASALASKKVFVFSAVIPQCDPGGYWKMIEDGLLRAEKELTDFKVTVQIQNFDQYDSSSFVKAMDKVLKTTSDGVLLAPVSQTNTLVYTHKMDEMSIPYVFIDSRVEGANQLAYYGQDSFQSGYLGAKLLFTQKPDLKKIVIFSFFDPKQTPSNQIGLRMEGFKSYTEKNVKGCKTLLTTLSAKNLDENEKIMEKLFSDNPDIGGAVLFSSKAYVVANFLHKHKLNQISMIGYDLLEKNVDYLKKNTISYLIAQRPEEQAYKGIKAFSDSLIFKKNVQQINFAPIDILTQENIDYYLGF